MDKSAKQEISLGYPLDLLLNRDCKPSHFDSKKKKIPPPGLRGIQLPVGDSAGTGNIVIKGKPGTGKSTLALQIAVACTQDGNNCSAAFFPMEEQIEHVINKAKAFGWKDWLRPVKHLQNVSESPSAEELGQFLDLVLRQPDDCPIVAGRSPKWDDPSCQEHLQTGSQPEPKVLLPALSPRSIQPADSRGNKLFWERYQQLEDFLDGAEWLRKQYGPKYPAPRVVCLDSLNTFGDRLLEREEIFRIFDLFKRHKTIGIFILEVYDEEHRDSVKNLHQNTIEYLADTVISLQATEDNGYYIRYLEIEKSRYRHQIYGQHPFRLRDFKEEKRSTEPSFRQAYEIFPSLHYLVSAIGRPNPEPSHRGSHPAVFDFGIRGINLMLPTNLTHGSMAAIEGPKATFKTTLAINFLLRGLVNEKDVLLIELRDNLAFNKEGLLFNRGLSKGHIKGKKDLAGKEIVFLEGVHDKLLPAEEDERLFVGFEKPPKIRVAEWKYGNGPWLVELTFSEGMLLPEEFIQTVRDVFDTLEDNHHKIKCVVLDDVSRIGTSYPYLRKSKTASDLFLPSFVHLMRNYSVDLIMTGTTSGLKEADDMVDRACALADTVITCRNCDIFGDRFVVVSGEGLVAGIGQEVGKREPVPGVIRIEKINHQKLKIQPPFLLDMEFLQGLVGFDTQNIHRPGLSLHMMEASAVTRQYNDEVEKLLQFALARPTPSTSERRHPTGQAADVSLIPFDTRLAEPMYSSLAMLRDAPIDRTVVCTLDEFLENQPDEDVYLVDVNKEDCEVHYPEYVLAEKMHGWPYYANVLLLAYRRDLLGSGISGKEFACPDWSRNWTSILEVLEKCKGGFKNVDENPIHVPFDYADLSHETMACFLTDAIFSGFKQVKCDELEWSKIKEILDGEDADKFIQEIRAFQNLLLQRVPEYDPAPSSLEERMIQFGMEQASIEEISHWFHVPIRNLVKQQNEEGCADQPLDIKIKGGLRPDAAVYVCWYSQLRELLHEYRELAGKISICALPGGGVRGDLFLGIVKGSVSIQLGQKVINLLCNETEDFKRFSRGIGLPMRKVFRNKKFHAWPGATDIDLDDILKIHENAAMRSKIPHYMTIRHALANALEELLLSKTGEEATLREVLEWLAKQTEAFKPGPD